MSHAKPRRGRPFTGRALSPAERMRRFRARQRAAGLLALTRWSAAPPGAISPGVLKHRIIEARSLGMHCLIASKIFGDPRLLGRARRNLEVWRARYGAQAPKALDDWQQILDRPWPEIAAIITDPGERSTQLRQSSPFAGVLTARERRRVYEAFRA